MHAVQNMNHDTFMRRCFDLARLGSFGVQTNPMVGCVIVHESRVIGEGYHEAIGKPHAEVNAINAVRPEDRKLLRDSTLYVSLEPCNHFGRTPPCSLRIVQEKIPRVVISCPDPNPDVTGKGANYLREHGVDVTMGILEEEGRFLIRRFLHWVKQRLPYVTLKWAQSKNLLMGVPGKQVWLSNAFSKVLVHKLRAEHAGIMVGTDTALTDKPKLNTREYPGPSPVRIIPDRKGRIPDTHPLFSDGIPTLLYSGISRASVAAHVTIIPVDYSGENLGLVLEDLAARNIHSLMVEGGAALLNAFIKDGLWQEAWVIRVKKAIEKGIKAPLLHGTLREKFNLEDDEVLHIQNRAPGNVDEVLINS